MRRWRQPEVLGTFRFPLPVKIFRANLLPERKKIRAIFFDCRHIFLGCIVLNQWVPRQLVKWHLATNQLAKSVKNVSTGQLVKKIPMPTWCIMLSCDIFDELSHVGDDFSTNCCCTKEMRHTHSGKRQNVVLLIKIFMLIPYNGIFADKTPNNYFSIDQNGNRFFI